MAQDVFDHDNGAVHNHAKIECAKKRSQEHDSSPEGWREEQGEGNCNGNDQGATDIAEEKERTTVTRSTTIAQVAQNRVRGCSEPDRFDPNADDFDALGEAVVEFANLLVEGTESASASALFAERTMPSTTSSSLTRAPSSRRNRFAQLAEAYWRLHDSSRSRMRMGVPAGDFDEGGSNVSGVSHQADGSNVERLLARSMNPPPALMLVVGRACST